MFDLDGVLYDGGNGYLQSVRRRATEYILRHNLNGVTTREEAEELRRAAFAKANQTAVGLRELGCEFDAEEFAAYCRAEDVDFLMPDPLTRAALVDTLGSYRKVILTNTREKHAAEALRLLGLDDGVFEDVYGVDFTGRSCKPCPEAFVMVLERQGVAPSEAVMVEDSLRNAKAARSVGMTVAFVPGEGQGVRWSPERQAEVEASVDCVLPSLTPEHVAERMPFLLAG